MKITLKRFASGYIREGVREKIAEFIGELGEANLIKLARAKRDLSSLAKPEVIEGYKKKAQQLSRFAQLFTASDIIALVDTQLREAIELEPGGREWLERQAEFLRSLFI